MRFNHPIVLLAMVVVAAGLLSGCRADKEQQAPAPPATEDRVRMIRQSYQTIDPGARVGLVAETLPEYRLVAVSEMPVDEFREGDVVTFIDTNEEVLVNGRVVAKTDDALHVKYDEPSKPGQRAPQKGDMAVRFTR